MKEMNMKKYTRIFVPNPNHRFDTDTLRDIAKEIVYVCDRPMFDNLMGDEYIADFEHRIASRMEDFDPKKDAIAFYGDSMIFAIMIMWIADNHSEFDLARFSTKEGKYMIRRMSYDNFTEQTAVLEQTHSQKRLVAR